MKPTSMASLFVSRARENSISPLHSDIQDSNTNGIEHVQNLSLKSMIESVTYGKAPSRGHRQTFTVSEAFCMSKNCTFVRVTTKSLGYSFDLSKHMFRGEDPLAVLS